jgi:hypothetical protein
MMAALLRMFLAALRSAFWLCPQRMQQNFDRVGRFDLAMCPQALHFRLVLRGPMMTNGTPANLAL